MKLSALVVSTTSAGFLAAGGPISYDTLIACSLGTALCASSAATFNQILEVDRDAKMNRTKNRPLIAAATGNKNNEPIISMKEANVLGFATGISGGALLGMYTDPVTTSLGVFNIALYAGLYTYMKPRSEWNTWIGAIVGAIPPCMGWTASGGSLLDIESILLGSTLFLWQFPHFFALSFMHRKDYSRGGFQMVPVNEMKDEKYDRTAKLITNYTLYLSTIPFISTYADVTSSMFLIESIPLNLYAFYVAKKFDKERTNKNARTVFLTSLWYLPTFMTLFILHSKTWLYDEEEEKNRKKKTGDLRDLLQSKINAVRQKGKELCVHEVVIGSSATSAYPSQDPKETKKVNDSSLLKLTPSEEGDTIINTKTNKKENQCPIVMLGLKKPTANMKQNNE
eukprot:CAMPEP_0178970124 /NCGR_PEP_ID=MMETSP0789-20121207/19316_1 /TAXON_ID=3005 /ORGANISM="Rhizosolenia setigera, Strain CCMP 1694" /LENGTH=395 /DNA_ID=CAMNT_0020656491 /DNA_START=214 /DNA_END=1401 /DNA_ORIENTATION=-